MIQKFVAITGGLSLIPLLLALLGGTLVGTGGYAVYYGEGTSYLSNDPKSCVNCHIMREHHDGWAKSSHHAVAVCNDCHAPHDLVGKYVTKAENGFWHSKAFTLGDYKDPLVIRERNSRVLQESCIHCHAELTSNVARHAHGHDAYESGVSCVHCHPSVGHGPVR